MLERLWEGESTFTVGGGANRNHHCGKQFGEFSKKLNLELPFDLIHFTPFTPWHMSREFLRPTRDIQAPCLLLLYFL